MYIGEHIFKNLGAIFSNNGIHKNTKLLIVTDEIVYKLHYKKLEAELINCGLIYNVLVLGKGEKNKSVDVFSKVISFALENSFDRNSAFVALGGGSIGDLTGFAASTYMRGVKFVQVPTTLLAHDSSIGGKTALNFSNHKNIIGSFYQPELIIYDIALLQTLNQREYLAGLAEIVIHSILDGEDFYDYLCDNSQEILNRNEKVLQEIIYKSAKTKARYVQQDVYEKNMRAKLNLGHTFGHALESLTDYSLINHGEAISIGCLMAAALSEKVYNNKIIPLQIIYILKRLNLIPLIRIEILPKDLLGEMYKDKKVRNGKLTFIIPDGIGNVNIHREKIDQNTVEECIGGVIKYINGLCEISK
ncbi:hypothetical protein TU58_01335 [Bacillus cereus]|nr:hypothetical protein TU58_01335 [Bacillus cereus]